ncbi:TetR/AcrR family transcriptional regulator [Lentzea sp. NPDC102401]|uniref:TetR/AcrR family transcriptional regulator n=1 Tax=Lentzea sp. NPDC102401 TaxID=3364128 RepID=UPI003826E17D
MSARGDATRAKLIATTIRLVSELGYTKTTTRAIAQAAGIAEGTLYRHFPDKATLFGAAVLHKNQQVVDWVENLPDRAGTATVVDNLTDCLTHLAALRTDVIPLELAILTDPELARAAPPPGSLPGPPGQLAQYLEAEQQLGRLRRDADPVHTAIVLLAMLFGLAISPPRSPAAHSASAMPTIRDAVELVLQGLDPHPARTAATTKPPRDEHGGTQ